MISVFCSSLACRYHACHKSRFFTQSLSQTSYQGQSDSLSQVLLQSLHHPQFIHITTAKIIVAIIHLHVSFFLILSWVCQGGICKQTQKKKSIKAKNKPKGVKPKMSTN